MKLIDAIELVKTHRGVGSASLMTDTRQSLHNQLLLVIHEGPNTLGRTMHSGRSGKR